MQNVSSPYFDPEFENLAERIYGPSCMVCIDNETLEDSTLVKVDSLNKQGLLLKVVQILTNMNLIIKKGYISSDARWFMDVFHVKDENNNKLTDQIINHIHKAIDLTSESLKPITLKHNPYIDISKPENPSGDHTTIEITGTDRPGLFSEISAALTDLHCNVVEAHAWSHNARLACVAQISDQSTHTPIDDPLRLATIEDHLTTVLRATTNPNFSTPTNPTQQEVKHGCELSSMSNVERRLHQLMLSVRDFDRPTTSEPVGPSKTRTRFHDDHESGAIRTSVRIDSCDERGYSIVNVEGKDRRWLMFDTLCTLNDLQYVVFHASIGSDEGCAYQEYFIRHVDGCALNTLCEKEHVIKCLEAAIERRVCEGVRLEVCANDRIGLLSDITRVLRENGLLVVRADIKTQGEKVVNAFYLRDVLGNDVDVHFVESMKKEMSPINYLNVKNETSSFLKHDTHEMSRWDMLKSQFGRLSHNFVQIK